MEDLFQFRPFGKIARLFREVIITEKIDGTNALVAIADDGKSIRFGSRSRWITPENDNMGFARWASEHVDELLMLGPGFHYGEWWGAGIQRRYGLNEKRFSLFNATRWSDPATRPPCCHVVPILYTGLFDTSVVRGVLDRLASEGSVAAPGFMKPEGIVVYHVASGDLYKATIEKDDTGKDQ